MARPKANQETPSAQERMREAFWEELEQRPYDQITVRGVAARAHVNKNAFYYHYDSLEELAADALRHALPPDLEHTLSDQFMNPSSGGFARMLESAGGIQCLQRMRLAAGRHSSVALQQALKDTIWVAACNTLGIDRATTSLDVRLAFEYIVGGALSVWSYCDEYLPDATPEDILKTDFFVGLTHTMPSFIVPLLQAQMGRTSDTPA